MSGGFEPPPSAPDWPRQPPWPQPTAAARSTPTSGWAPPVPHPRGRYRWVLVILGLLAVIAIALIASVVWFVNALRPPVDAMNDYLAAVSHGDYPAAYQMLCTDKRSTTSYDEYRLVTANFASGLTDYNVWSFDAFGSRRTVQYNFTRLNTRSGTHRATIVREAGTWRVCDFFDESRVAR